MKTNSRITYTGCLCLVIIGIFCLTACKTMEAITQVGAATGVVSHSQAKSISKSATAISKTFEDISPEQEYYIGRTVGAIITSKYKVYNNRKANKYLNTLGQTLAQASDMPETFGGYHFLLLDSKEINAFAAPGGLIFVTRGMIRCCKTEDALAAVLAHEIGHVENKHGLQSIKKSRLTSALTTLALEGTKQFGSEELASVTDAFEGSISDITSTLITNGYSRSFEKEADLSAITTLKRVGYNPTGLKDMLSQMDKQLKPGGPDFAKTHPAPKKRISSFKSKLSGFSKVKTNTKRQARFKKAMGKV